MHIHDRDFFVPLNEIHQVSDRVRSNVVFPDWFQANKIGVSPHRVHRLMNIGGISRMTIGSLVQENTTTDSISVQSLNSDGSLTAGRVRSETSVAPHSWTNFSDHDHGMFQNTVWTRSDIRINLPTIQRKIQSEDQAVSRPEAWIPKLDHSIRSSIRASGINHLLRGLDSYRKMMGAISLVDGWVLDACDASLGDALVGLWNPHLSTPGELAGALAWNMVWWNGVSALGSKLRKDEFGHRFSLFPGYEVDRALILQGVSRIQPVLKKIDW